MIEYTNLIYSVAKKWVGSLANLYTIEDLMQEGFLALIVALPKYDSKKSKLTTYIYNSLRYHYKNLRAKEKNLINEESKIENAIDSEDPIDETSIESISIDSFEDSLIEDLHYKEFETTIKDERIKAMLSMKKEGYRDLEIGNTLGVSERWISELSRKTKKQFMQQF